MAELCFLTNVTGEQWAAWTQAVLSAAAIIASVGLVNHQHKLELQREADNETQRKRQHLESTFQLVGAVFQVLTKVKEWSESTGYEPHDGSDLWGMKIELEGLIDALRQTDFGRFDQHMPIEAVLVALTAARLMDKGLTTTPQADAVAPSDVEYLGKTATLMAGLVKSRLDKIYAAFPSNEVKH